MRKPQTKHPENIDKQISNAMHIQTVAPSINLITISKQKFKLCSQFILKQNSEPTHQSINPNKVSKDQSTADTSLKSEPIQVTSYLFLRTKTTPKDLFFFVSGEERPTKRRGGTPAPAFANRETLDKNIGSYRIQVEASLRPESAKQQDKIFL